MKIKLHSIETGNFKLDGGAMFGVVPKVIWNNLNPADDKNLCNWAMRCLLIVTESQKILIDCGIGNKQSEKFFGFYNLNGSDSLLSSLRKVNTDPQEITDVILTHLHFDHCGGALVWNNDKSACVPVFPNARYHVSEEHWKHANSPNDREKASFLLENFRPLEELGILQLWNGNEHFNDCIYLHKVEGHTVGMLCPEISIQNKSLFYGADLYPSSAHLPVNYVMGYDIEPLKTMQERKQLGLQLLEKNAWIFFEHDLTIEIAQIAKNDKGQFFAQNPSSLSQIF